MPKEIRTPKHETSAADHHGNIRDGHDIKPSDFDLRTSFGIRNSEFGFNETLPPDRFFFTARRHAIRFTRDLLWVRIASQTMCQFQVLRCPCAEHAGRRFPDYISTGRYRISTSRFGIGEQAGSNKTPRGLHRIAEKIGGGWPGGTVFKHRQVVGFTWKGFVPALITTRIMWLEGLEPGFNRGGNVDSHDRYIYIHGTGDETTLGRPASHGCVHVGANDLIPLFNQLPSGTLVWISER